MEIAITGSKTKSADVLRVLEMLGGENLHHLTCSQEDKNYCIQRGVITLCEEGRYYNVYKIEDFLRLHPYQLGDEVEYNSIGDLQKRGKIISMEWFSYEELVFYTIDNGDTITNYDILRKLDELKYKNNFSLEGDLIEQSYRKESKDKTDTFEGNVFLLSAYKMTSDSVYYKLPSGYELNTSTNDEIILKKKNDLYPSSYSECCNIIGSCLYSSLIYDIKSSDTNLYDLHNLQQFEIYRKLIVCRDAYWKIYGESLGGNIWSPDWVSEDNKYSITTNMGEITYMDVCHSSSVLVFPTEELRQLFHNNFPDLIDSCKEFL